MARFRGEYLLANGMRALVWPDANFEQTGLHRGEVPELIDPGTRKPFSLVWNSNGVLVSDPPFGYGLGAAAFMLVSLVKERELTR